MEKKFTKSIYTLSSHLGTVVSILRPSPKSDFLISLSNDKFVKLWNISFGNFINYISYDACPTKLVILRKFNYLLIPKWNNDFALLDMEILKMAQKNLEKLDFEENEIILKGHKSWVLNAIDINYNKNFDNHFLTCSRDKTVRLWDFYSRSCEACFIHEGVVNDIKEIDSSRIGSVSSDTTIKIWDLNLMEEVQSIKDGVVSVFQLEIIKNYNKKYLNKDNVKFERIYDKNDKIYEDYNKNFEGIVNKNVESESDISDASEIDNYADLLAIRNESNEIKIYDYIQGTITFILSGHKTNIICFKVLKNGNIITGSYDHTAKIWDRNKKFNCILTLVGHDFTIYALEEMSDGTILTASGDFSIKAWEQKSGKCICTFGMHKNYVVTLLAISKNQFVSGSYDGDMKIFKLD